MRGEESRCLLVGWAGGQLQERSFRKSRQEFLSLPGIESARLPTTASLLLPLAQVRP